MIKANQCITIDEVAEKLRHAQTHKIIHNILQYQKASACWVARQLIFQQCFVHCHHNGKEFLFQIVTGDVTRDHHFTSKLEAVLRRGNIHLHLPERHSKEYPSAGKVLLTAFWCFVAGLF